MKKIENYINGSISSISSKTLPVHDSSTGEIIANVVYLTKMIFKKL